MQEDTKGEIVMDWVCEKNSENTTNKIWKSEIEQNAEMHSKSGTKWVVLVRRKRCDELGFLLKIKVMKILRS